MNLLWSALCLGNPHHSQRELDLLPEDLPCVHPSQGPPASTHTHTHGNCDKPIQYFPHINSHRSTLRHLGYEDPQLRRLATADVEAQLCPWWLFQHDGTGEELGELVVVVRVMDSLTEPPPHKRRLVKQMKLALTYWSCWNVCRALVK